MEDDTFRFIRKIIDQQNQLRKITDQAIHLRKMVEPAQRLIDFSKEFTHMYDSIVRIRESMPKVPSYFLDMQEQADRMIRIRESIELFNKNLPGYLVSIASYGWYLDFQTDFNLPIRLIQNIFDSEIEKVDSFLIEYYTNSFDTIIKKLSTNHPKRSKLFDEIKIAFDNRYYNLAIPIILSQIDGICYDYTQKLFFKKNDKKVKNPYLPEVSNELIAFNNEFSNALLAPFLNNAPIFADIKRLELFPTAFNRHMVLHGKDVNYGTEINCLKAVSLLSYCEDILSGICNDLNPEKKI